MSGYACKCSSDAYNFLFGSYGSNNKRAPTRDRCRAGSPARGTSALPMPKKPAKDGHKPPMWSEAMYGSAHGEWEAGGVLAPANEGEKVKASRNLRSGKGKMRNRRYVQRKGPLVVYANDSGITKAMRNIPGVELCSVDRLGLLTLAPGGHVGRFIIWTKSAFEKLDSIYGTSAVKSAAKKGWKPPTNIMAMPDLSRVINSDEIQSAINPPKEGKTRAHAPLKRNPLKNKSAMDRLNPYAKVAAEMRAKAEAASSAAKAKKTAGARSKVGQAFYEGMKKESNYEGELFDGFATWLKGKPSEEEEA